MLGAWDWLVAQGADAARIGLYGPSLGAGTVTIATGEEPRVAATFADSSYYSFDVAAREYTESEGYPGWVVPAGVFVGRLLGESELGTRDPASEIVHLAGRPYAIVQGLADTTVLAHNAVDLAAAVCGGHLRGAVDHPRRRAHAGDAASTRRLRGSPPRVLPQRSATRRRPRWPPRPAAADPASRRPTSALAREVRCNA